MTDRAIRTPADLVDLDFAKGDGLVAVVVQDAHDGTVLMLGCATRAALEATLDSGEVHFWSRSREALWRKGETSGNVLSLVSLHADCDGDAVLARVEPAGPTCHTGERSCFGEGTIPAPAGTALDELWRVIEARDAERPEGSYTARLLGDPNLRTKKLGEESAELVAALASGNADAVRGEAADLIYHLLVALRAAGVTLQQVTNELRGRRG